MKRNFVELGKTILIVLLALCVLALAALNLPSKTITSTPWLSAVLKPFAPLLGLSEAELTYTETDAQLLHTAAAQPIAISVHTDAGRSSAIYQFEALDADYEALGSFLAQALDSADSLKESSRLDLRQALQGQSVAFHYPLSMQPSVFAAWLGAGKKDLPQSEWFVLSAEADCVRLYLVDETVSVCKTTIDMESFTSTLAQYTPDGSYFAFEAGGSFDSVDEMSLLPGTETAYYMAQVSNPCEAKMISALAVSLGFNPYGDASYTDAEGNTSFTETDRSLVISSSGQMSLRLSGSNQALDSISNSAEDQIEAAREFLEQVFANTATDARLYLTGYSQSGDSAVCSFGYYLSGIPVALGQENAAEVVFSGPTMTKADVFIRAYALQETKTALLPPAQAAAILPKGAALTALYVDSGAQVVSLNWQD